MIDLVALALSCGLAIPDETLVTLAAVVRTESGGNPYAIGVNDGPRLVRQPGTKAEAVAVARRLADLGRSFDAGLGQINILNFGWLGLDIERVFDSCENLRATHRVLAEAYGRSVKRHEPGQPALRAALSVYNTGDFRRGVTNGYVQKVAANVVVPALEPSPLSIRVKPVRQRTKSRQSDVRRRQLAPGFHPQQPQPERKPDDAPPNDAREPAS